MNDEDHWEGSIVFRLTSNEHGRVTDMCVVGGNLGNVTKYIECVAREISQNAMIPPNLKREEWTLTFIME